MHVERGAFVKPLLPWKNNKFYISVCVRACVRARVCVCGWLGGWMPGPVGKCKCASAYSLAYPACNTHAS